jgi:hypothetical protein
MRIIEQEEVSKLKFEAIMEFLERKGKHRGWSKRREATGPDDGPVEVAWEKE